MAALCPPANSSQGRKDPSQSVCVQLQSRSQALLRYVLCVMCGCWAPSLTVHLPQRFAVFSTVWSSSYLNCNLELLQQ